ncbi:hypothetical protein SAMN05216319_0024 [Duganella sp. CF402]|uniref:hypothetical protein n=1 Tax=unclassified Duganella TaxID=2636909 RepID=UPI0008AD2FCC|nr:MULTISPECIES: hypothetical protein [unclassified Duganella]RZT11489.1 hypothetical protein EV582_3602 [Duganella sp. BK701]SEK62474.1 hypothetical protein SAMN05216319_0024 [Duganella sp. CF402]
MVRLVISDAVAGKLVQKHNVTQDEVSECFENRSGKVLIDDRALHRRNQPTLWFIAETTSRRLLKVVFQIREESSHLITAYEPNVDEIRIYETQGGL